MDKDIKIDFLSVQWPLKKKKKKKKKCIINIRIGFLDFENLGKDTTIDFLSQILSKLCGIDYLAHLVHTAILFFAYMTKMLLKDAGVALF